MTRVVEADPKVLVMRNPKTETKQQFMARAEKLADELYVEPVVEQTTNEVVGEIIEQVSAVKIELEYLRWWYQNADFGPADSDVRRHLNNYYVAGGGVIPDGYKEEE